MYFDIFAIIFILGFAFFMMKKGGVQSLFSLVSIVISIVIALNIYPYLSRYLYNTSLEERVGEMVMEALSESDVTDVVDTISAMPDVIADTLMLSLSGTGEEIQSVMAENITKTVIDIITFILVLLVTRVILFVLSAMLDIVTKIPVIRQANSLIGFMGGILTGYVVLCVIVYFLSIVAVGNEELTMIMNGSCAVDIISRTSPF